MSLFVMLQRGHIFNYRCSVNCCGLCSYWRSSIRSKNNLQRDISSSDCVTDSRRITCAIQENATLLHHKMKETQEENKSPTGGRHIKSWRWNTSRRSRRTLLHPNELPTLSVRRSGEVEWLCYVPTNYQRCPYDVPDKSKDSVTSNKLPALSLR